jgi:hypothetical protein
MLHDGSFKHNGDRLFGEYTGGIKVFLESTDDQYIVGRKWFSHLKDKISFESVSETRADGGCQIVRKKVQESNDCNQKAFGIVDRDILLADPDFQNSVWLEVNDDIFTSAQPYGEAIFVLHYWELENYLLHPQALKSLVADKTLMNPPTITATTIADLLIQHEDNLVAVTLLSTIPAKNMEGQVAEGFGRDSSGVELKEKIATKLNISHENIQQEHEKIKCFAENESDAIARWNKLSRMLDGKRIMNRIDQILSDEDMADCKVSLTSERGALAGYITNQKIIDPFLVTWLDDIYNSSVS